LGVDEPLLWSPPGSVADGILLPGRDPVDIDLAAARHLLIDQDTPPSLVAKQLGVSIDHIRYALHTLIERPVRRWGRNAAPLAMATQQRARALLTPEFFQREYVTGGSGCGNYTPRPDFTARCSPTTPRLPASSSHPRASRTTSPKPGSASSI
jgi:hypothetical protein